MGKIYLQTFDGSRIHLPVVGADVNNPDSVTFPSVALLGTRNRCYSGTVQVIIPTIGTVTFNFDPPGRTGSCNQCGQCCTHPIASCPDPGGVCGWTVDAGRGIHRCPYLTILPKGIGKANGTECSLYATILDSFKGCAFFPSQADEILPHMTACGFSFS